MNDQERRVALRAFLGECRARIKPEDAGLRLPGRRRVPGLRREEVAQRAGVSAAWYTLLETARDIRVSPRMLDRVASALQLAADEKLYLFSLAIAEMPTIARCDIAGSGAVGTEYAELTRFAKKARSAPTLSDLEELTTEFLFELARHPEVAYFVRADLDSREFWFSAQQVSPNVRPMPASRLAFTAVDDSEPVLIRGSIHAEHNLVESPHEIMRERARILGTGRFMSAGIKAGDLTAAVGYAEPSREPHSERERYLLGLVAEIVALALTSRR